MDLESLKIIVSPLKNKIGAVLSRRKARRVISDFNEFLPRPLSGTSVNPKKRALVSYVVF